MAAKQAGLIGEALTKFSETHEDYWLAAAALIYFSGDKSVPSGIKQFVTNILLEVLEVKSHSRRKAFTSLTHDRYINEMRELMFLTGTGVEDAAGRIVAFHAQRQDPQVPTDMTLLNWWNNRKDNLKLPLSVDDLIYGSYELAEEFTRFLRSKECSPGTPKVAIEIKPEIKEQFDALAGLTADPLLLRDFAMLVRNPQLQPLIELFKYKAPYTDFHKIVSRFRKHFPDF